MLGLIFLKYISDSFSAQQDKIRAELSDPENPLYLDRTFYSSDEEYQEALDVELENRDYYTADNVFWVPACARWQALQEVSILNMGAPLPWGGKFAGVARLIDDAFDAIEKDNAKLKGVLQRISGYAVDESTLRGLIMLFSDTNFTAPSYNGQPVHLGAKDILGHVYEYFLGRFAQADDPRWAYGTPPKGNANFAWLQHMIYHLSPNGKMALLLANGSMSSQTNNEGEIRKAIVEADLVEAMVALPGQLFTNTQIPACIWFLNRNKARKSEVLFIDARQIGYMKDRVLRDFTADDIAKIADTFHVWQKSDGYEDQAAFCKSASLDDIKANDYVLTPGRYVGTAEQEDDGVPFAEKMQNLTALLKEQFAKSAELEAEIKKNLGGLGYE